MDMKDLELLKFWTITAAKKTLVFSESFPSIFSVKISWNFKIVGKYGHLDA